MGKLVSATKWTTVATIVNIILTMVQLAYLARILSPTIFGQFAIVNLVIEIFVAFALGGISNFLLYKRDADQATSNAIYFLALGIGVLFSVLLYVLTPFIASHLGYGDIIQELKLATILLIISSLSSQYQALGMKNFEHKKIALIDIIAKCASFSFALITSELELLCLVGAVVVYQLVKLLGQMLFLGKHVNLSFSVNSAIYREAFSYGIFDFGSQALNIVRKQLDIMILAVTLQTNELGVYHVIKQLASRPAQALQPIIGKVALPAFSEVKAQKDKLKNVYQDFYLLQLTILAFIYAPIIVASELVLGVFFGTEYMQHEVVLSLLAAFWFIRIATSNLIGPLVQSTGLTKRNFLWNIYLVIPNSMVIYFSSLLGVEALLIAMVVFQMMLFPLVNFYFISYIAGVSFSYSLRKMLIIMGAMIMPLFVFYTFVVPFISDKYFFREVSIALCSVLLITIAFIISKDIQVSLKRMKGF
ncbi:hypothetical protein C7Y69_18040 [Alteromonas sp. KS69]|uniref:oligosaccharide flippase family protein n=1 Tax=Alteromonas sp. KS69 TaxID=2109917 RepID=UPI000F87D526|nr:oligosaccharide flippase family protein [Alteromonas sp. KS69]RUP76221.1 hypothetical protein C7Y69_18040 [Alteromonas sp. KS69]